MDGFLGIRQRHGRSLPAHVQELLQAFFRGDSMHEPARLSGGCLERLPEQQEAERRRGPGDPG